MKWLLKAASAVALSAGLMAPQASAAENDVDAAQADISKVSYAKEVSRLIQARCETCHRPEGIAPFSMTNYRQVRGWAKMIKEVINDGRMPPWHADPRYGHFKNDRRLTEHELALFNAWLDNGMAKGDDADLPEPANYGGEWRVGTPDIVLVQPEEVTIDPTGVVPYMYFTQDPGFKEDIYVTAAEALAGNIKVVHHIIVTWFLPEGVNKQYPGQREGFLIGTAPGDMPLLTEPGQARLIPAGAHLRWQMHYTPTGKVEKDQSRLGLMTTKEMPAELIMTNSPGQYQLDIPPHAENHMVETTYTTPQDIRIVSFMPHMHLRGKAYRYEVKYPDGREEILLDIPKYDFNWQATYRLTEPKFLPKGTQVHLVAHFDNSDKNPYNPDPNKNVHWGDQTWEEMMIGWHDFVIKREDLAQVEKTSLSGD